jgi:hypothetical protein
MSAEQELAPAAEPAEDSPAVPEPVPDNTVRSELQAASRSARYALITAVSAAVISSFVAAGSAVYVSTTQANRAEQMARSQAVRTDRQKTYSDFSMSLYEFVQQLAFVHGRLQSHQPMESVGPELTELTTQQYKFLAGLNLLLMAGSSEMQDVAAHFADAIYGFARDHLLPFSTRYFAPDAAGANDPAGWQRDSTEMVAAMSELETKLGELNGQFIEQGSRELR